jgi:hypothetical protein
MTTWTTDQKRRSRRTWLINRLKKWGYTSGLHFKATLEGLHLDSAASFEDIGYKRGTMLDEALKGELSWLEIMGDEIPWTTSPPPPPSPPLKETGILD